LVEGVLSFFFFLPILLLLLLLLTPRNIGMTTELTLNNFFNNANCVSSFVRVRHLLEELKLEKYFKNFEFAEINDQALSLINDSCLREAGIPVGSRLLILDAIKKGKPSTEIPRLFRYQAQPNKQAAAMITTPDVQITGPYQKRTSLPLHFAVPSFSMCDFIGSNNSLTCGSDTSTASYQNSFKTRNDTPLSLHLCGYNSSNNNGQEMNVQTESKRFVKSRTSTKRKPYKNSKSCQYHYDKKASCNESCMGHIYFPRGTYIPKEFWKIAKGNHIEEHVAIFKAFVTTKNLAHPVETPITTSGTINSGNMLLSFDQLCATLNVPLTHKCK